MDQRRVRTIVGVALGVLLVIGFGASRLLAGLPADGGGGPPPCDEAIAWDDTDGVVGRSAAVVGPVADAAFAPDVGGEPTFLNLGAAHPDPDRFDIVVYADVREGFADRLEERFVGRTVCVRGEVREREGVPQIVLDHPSLLTER